MGWTRRARFKVRAVLNESQLSGPGPPIKSHVKLRGFFDFTPYLIGPFRESKSRQSWLPRDVAPAGFEPLLGGSGESRPLPIRVILQGFFVARLPNDPFRFRPFPTAPLENVRNTLQPLAVCARGTNMVSYALREGIRHMRLRTAR
jgi:hypothetical protein